MKKKVVRIKERDYENLYKTKSTLKIVLICIGILVGILVMGSLLYMFLKKSSSKVSVENEISSIAKVSFYQGEIKTNTIKGQYTKPKDSNGGEFLNTVSNREIYVSINSKEKYDSLEYKVVSEDGKERKESGSVKAGNANKSKLKKNKNEIVCKIKFDKEIDTEPQNLILTLKNDKQKVFFTTKIKKEDEIYASENLKFANDFENSTFSPKKLKKYESYLESNRNESDESFSHVTIKSSFDYMCYNNLELKKISNPMCYIIKADSKSCVYNYKYRVSLKVNGHRQNYFVNEAIETKRDLKDANKFYILSYDRCLYRQLKEKDSLNENGVLELGIGNEIKVSDRVISKNGEYLTFIINGELYQFNKKTNIVDRLYPLFNEDSMEDYITSNRKITINNVDENGNVDFSVIGNNGYDKNIGKTGNAIYYYENDSRRVYEDFFIESGLGFSDMANTLNRFVSNFHNKEKVFYYINKGLYKKDNTKEEKIVSIDESKLFSSKNGKIAAYENSDGTITLQNFLNEKDYTIEKDDAKKLQIIGFTGENLLYGISKTDEYVVVENGEKVLPMESIKLVDADLNEIKEYNVDGKIFLKGVADGTSIVLTLGVKADKTYLLAGTDYITRPEEDIEKEGYFENYYDEKYGYMNEIIYSKGIENDTQIKTVNLVTKNK